MTKRSPLLAAIAFALAGTAPGQAAALQVQVTEGENAVHIAGSRSSRPLTVLVTDENGNPVESAAVSFHLPQDGPGGAFTNGLRTDVATTDARGRASSRNIQFNRTAGSFEIRIFASKEHARAGTISLQYVSQSKGPRGRKKWIGVIAAVAGGGAVGAVLASRSRSGTEPVATLTIGAPTISVGKP